MILLGLTGSIGMGKSTVLAMFRDLGIPVYDADAGVHQAYARGGAAIAPVEAAFPGVTVDGTIDREKLSARVLNDPAALKRLEAIVHPIVAETRRTFLGNAQASGAALAVLDIPLLFETGGAGAVDKIAVVSAPAETQRQRVLARPGMTADKFDAILARQTPDGEKRAGADFVIDTGVSLDDTRQQVQDIVTALTAGGENDA